MGRRRRTYTVDPGIPAGRKGQGRGGEYFKFRSFRNEEEEEEDGCHGRTRPARGLNRALLEEWGVDDFGSRSSGCASEQRHRGPIALLSPPTRGKKPMRAQFVACPTSALFLLSFLLSLPPSPPLLPCSAIHAIFSATSLSPSPGTSSSSCACVAFSLSRSVCLSVSCSRW